MTPDRNSIDLRRGNVVAVLLGLLVFGSFAGGMWWSIVWGPPVFDSAPLSLVVATVASAMLLLGVWVALQLRHTWRLVIDHEGIRLEVAGRKPRWRLAWTELAGIGTVGEERRTRGIARHIRRVREMPPVVPTAQALLIDPLDADAVRRHPELATAWKLGAQQQWRIPIGVPRPDQPTAADLVRRWRPELWRGQRTGSVFFG